MSHVVVTNEDDDERKKICEMFHAAFPNADLKKKKVSKVTMLKLLTQVAEAEAQLGHLKENVLQLVTSDNSETSKQLSSSILYHGKPLFSLQPIIINLGDILPKTIERTCFFGWL